MSDWIKREAKSIRNSDRQRELQQRLQLHRAEVLKAKAPEFFAEGARATQKAVRAVSTFLRQPDSEFTVATPRS